MSYALITGASKGIGRELAIALAKRKFNVLLVARSEDILKELAEELAKKYQVKAYYKAIDLSEPNADKALYDWSIEQNFPVSFLVNNAGYGLWGPFETLSLADQQNMVQVNTVLPVNLAYRFLPLLKKNAPGYILNVASTAAYQAVPKLTLYAATKAFIVLFSRGLRIELKKSNVSVTCLSPGPVDTGFVDRAGLHAVQELANRFSMSADKVAEFAVKATLNKKTEVIPGFTNWLGAFLNRIFPKSIIELVVGSIYNK